VICDRIAKGLPMSMQSAARAAFRKLHESGCFVIPNPWDAGTARYLRRLGFKALATTSSGFSFSQALPDMDWAVPVDMALGHIAEIVAATELPVNADFESGYAHEPEGVAANVKRCVATGVAGLSIEDASGDKDKPLYDQAFAVERIAAARAAIDASGADVLLAPGPRKRDDIQAIVAAAGRTPVNVLMGSNIGLTVSDLAGLGVRRISVGSALSRAAWTGFIRAAKLMAEEGSFAGFDGSVAFAELNGFFREDLKERSR